MNHAEHGPRTERTDQPGASAPDITQAETKKLMMSIAARVLLIFDAGKIGRTSFACLAPLEAIDTIVTDAIGPKDRARLEESGVDVIVAGQLVVLT